MRSFAAATIAIASAILASCGGNTPSQTAEVIRVGYFPNITHSQAIIGLSRGDFAEALGPDVTIEPITFNAGPSAIEALFAGEIDLTYIGPNPAITGYVRSGGEALRIVCGATSGGAALVVRDSSAIYGPADLSGTILASPQLGNTQDVALRRYLEANGLGTTDKGGTVTILPTENPQILDLFRQGQIEGAWVPEPWASRLVIEGGGRVLVDERDLWPNGRFVTAHLIASTSFLQEHPDLVRRWVTAHVEITRWELENPDSAKILLNAEIARMTGREIPQAVLDSAWARIEPTWDPVSSSLMASADAAWSAGFLDEQPDLSGIYDLAILDSVLDSLSLPPLEGQP
jgi:NitT/TauT family transport system substrate-binding protein